MTPSQTSRNQIGPNGAPLFSLAHSWERAGERGFSYQPRLLR